MVDPMLSKHNKEAPYGSFFHGC